jgi:thiamine-phosphate pyrophosphorylase
VTRSSLLPEDALLTRLSGAVEAGLAMIQVREKDLGAAELLRLTRAVQRAAIAGAGAPEPWIMVNGRFDVARAAGAQGVHLSAAGLPLARVRAACPPPFRIGISAHRGEDLRRAREEGADYAFLGPAFPTPSHPGAPALGEEGIERCLSLAKGLPVWAIGGIDERSASRLAGLPLAGVAAIRALLEAPDLARAVRGLADALTRRS